MKKSSITKVSGDVGIVQNTDPFPYEITNQAYGSMSNDILSKMIKNIEKLTKEDHEEIYMTLRRHKQESFFAINGMGTHFNIDGLSDQVKWNLHRVISLSLENKTRNQMLQQANDEHSDNMKKQYDCMHSDVTWVDEIRNPSEGDKTSYMLEMNLNQNKFGLRRDLVIS
jgi:hypothetical protein